MSLGNFVVSYLPYPTHFPHAVGRIPSSIDLFITRHSVIQPWIADQGPLSDYMSVEFFIHSQRILLSPGHFVLSFERADWLQYRQFLNENINLLPLSLDRILTTNQIDEMVLALPSYNWLLRLETWLLKLNRLRTQ